VGEWFPGMKARIISAGEGKGAACPGWNTEEGALSPPHKVRCFQPAG